MANRDVKRIGCSRIVLDGAQRNALVLPEGLTQEEWIKAGDAITTAEGSVMWWIGDWLIYGGKRYGETYAEAEAKTRFARRTLRIAKHVADQFEMFRRRNNLSWSHHLEVASLPEAEQDEWLDVAEKEGLSQKDLRVKLRQHRVTGKALDAAQGYIADEAIQIIHADCRTVIAEIQGGSLPVVITDPPYSVTENYWDEWETQEAYVEFMAGWLAQLRTKMAENFTAFFFCDATLTAAIHDMLEATGWPVLRQVIWHRPNLAKKRSGVLTFQSSYEPFWHCGTRPLDFPEEWGDERFDVQTFSAPQSTFVEDPSYHPTQKPLALIRRLVRLGSAFGETVFDPFCGSGTTAVACAMEKRRCLTCDTDASYIEIAKGRVASIE